MNTKRLRLLTPLLLALALIAALAVPNTASTSPAPPTAPAVTDSQTVAVVPVAYAGTVYLTFDDGPSYTYTPRILAVLRKYGVHAVFFELGQNITWYPSITRSLRYYGNKIGNHTWNHPDLTTLSNYWVTWQLNKMESALGYRPRCVRPPYGATNSRIATIIANRGQRQILWTVDPRDWSRPGTWTIVNRVLYYVRDGSRILLHDGGGDRSQTVAALDLLIPRLRARGFVIGLMAC
ncbi:polysaccharide deacetylase family protein [Terrabacter sp. NPDC080008]|uniref:polysaccharide deacetylase family protein n=1 Tax=Terrabacter sp. NPDC080008 TaxID=3155176 RepID=UPI003450D5B2